MTWEMVCGLEVHAELATRSKLFCACATAFGAAPNTQTCPVCLGMPGTLPRLNRRAVELALRTGLALSCSVTQPSLFERKQYFYPDTPKAYQTSQFAAPLCRDGALVFTQNGVRQQVRIHDIHLEEDAGKLFHPPAQPCTQIDYNRSGVPLIEVVTEPDLRSPEEAVAFLEALRETLLFLGVSDGKMQEGSMRADVNVSLRPRGSDTLYPRVEMKNISSFKAVQRAIAFEAARQTEILQSGGKIHPETRRWDDAAGTSTAMRAKGSAHDYRYFPDPDLPPLKVASAWLEEIRAQTPELAAAKRSRYQAELGLSAYDAAMLTTAPQIAALFEQALPLCPDAKELSNLILGDVLRLMNESGTPADRLRLSPADLASVARLILAGSINRATAQQVLDRVFLDGIDPETYVRENGLAMVDDEAAVQQAVDDVLRQHPQSVADYRAGKTKALRFLVGQTMKRMQGRANPKTVNQLLLKALEALL